MKQQMKDLYWVGATRKELGSLPPEVVDLFGYALHLAQSGMKHTQAKPLKGLGGVLEVVEDFKSDTYRAVWQRRLCPLLLPEKVKERHQDAQTGYGHY